MEQTTLQERIEARAEERLRQDLHDAYEAEKNIQYKFGQDNYTPQLLAPDHYDYNNRHSIQLKNDFTKELYKKLLPGYITKITDEILQKIDEIDYLVNQTENQETI